MDYETICRFDVLLASNRAASKGKKKKSSTIAYNAYELENLKNLQERLLSGSKYPCPVKVFDVLYPKRRTVQAPAHEDKVTLHAITDYGLYDAIAKGFIRDNCANQKGKGAQDAVIRLKHHLVQYYATYHTADGWVLKADIRHFFASIDHDKAKDKLKKICEKRGVDLRIYGLLCRYIDSTNPGLPLGYQTSQLIALLMLDDMDHFIQERRGFRFYDRGMDDFCAVGYLKCDLQQLLKEIRYLAGEENLELNEKTCIMPLRAGIDFLGFHTYLTDTGAVVQRLRRSGVKRIRAKVKRWKKGFDEGRLTADEIEESFRAWDAYAAFGDTYGLRKEIAKEVGGIIGRPVKARRKINSTRAQRNARREKQIRCTERKREREAMRNSRNSPEWQAPWE